MIRQSLADALREAETSSRRKRSPADGEREKCWGRLRMRTASASCENQLAKH